VPIAWAGTGSLVCKFQKIAKSVSKMSRRAALRHSIIFRNAGNPFAGV
jgi:hypothetical protein